MYLPQYGQAKFVVASVRLDDVPEEAVALLKMLALGDREIEQGQFTSVEEVFAALDRDDLP